MTQTYFPFDTGAGASITQAQWGQMAQYWLKTGVLKGVLNELQVYADSTGMQVKTKSGQAWMKGHFYSSDAEVVLPITTADSTNPRIDRIIIRVDWIADTVQLAVLQGAPASSPSVPALTQNVSRWEISLAQVRVNANVSTIAAGNITDERNFVKNANAIQANYSNLVGQNSWSALSGFDVPAYMIDEMGFVHLRGSFYNGVTTQGTVITTLPVGARPKYTQFVSMVSWYVSSPQTSVLYINPDGTITCYSNVGNTNLPLNMIPAFKAEQ